MAIDISNTFISLTGGCFCQAADGIEFSGQITAKQFCDARVFQGTVSGYASSGSTINKFSFSSDSNGVDVGELFETRSQVAGQSSETSGYTSGGNYAPGRTTTIDKFPFSSDTSATDVGEIIQGRGVSGGQSSKLQGFGYTSGGNAPPTVTTIDKFPFAVDSPAFDVGELTVEKDKSAGQSSLTHGYASAGFNPLPPNPNGSVIDRFPFATDANATDIGDVTVGLDGRSGQSSSTHGYSSGGRYGGPAFTKTNNLDKFPFASDSVTAASVGQIGAENNGSAGQSSTVSGYLAAGSTPSGATCCIRKFPFASDTDAATVGNLLAALSGAGQQV